MSKYLFTDGTGISEATSLEELESLVAASPNPGNIRIWIFSSDEWISYAAFRKQFPLNLKKEKPFLPDQQKSRDKIPLVHEAINNEQRSKKQQRSTNSVLKQFLFVPFAAAGIFLVFNFTRIKWEKAAPVNITAARPGNTPVMDIDSLVSEIESTRLSPLDRSTRTNLRLRNEWPDRIELRLRAEKETSSAGTRFSLINLSIDNTTGFPIDNAVVKFSVWRNDNVSSTDTIKFNDIRYDKLMTRLVEGVYRGDSISVSFESIRAKAFNFCYSANTKNRSGNYNDRWFCRE